MSRRRVRAGRWGLVGVLLGATALALLVIDVSARYLPGRPSPGRRAAMAMARAQGDPATATALARIALARNPIDIAAVRTLALVAQRRGADDHGLRLLRLAERLSRRDPATQVMLIEAAARRDDLDALLRHYDRALTVSASAERILLPRLAAMLASPPVRARILPLVAAHRPWRDGYLTAVATAPLSPSVVLAVARAANLKTEISSDARLLRLLVAGLFGAGATTEARQLAVSADTADTIVQDGRFDRPDGIVPFAWRLYNRGGWTVGTERDGDRGKLVLIATDATAEIVAEQTIRLASGEYVLSFRSASDSAQAAPRVSVICPAQADRIVLDVPASPEAPTVTRSFTIGRDACDNYRLRIAAGESAGSPSRAWLTDLAIRTISS